MSVTSAAVRFSRPLYCQKILAVAITPLRVKTTVAPRTIVAPKTTAVAKISVVMWTAAPTKTLAAVVRRFALRCILIADARYRCRVCWDR